MSPNIFKASADFGHSLFKDYLENNKDSNCVLSPVSVFFCMSMLERGAQGETKAEIHQALCTSPDYCGSEVNDVINTLNGSCGRAFTLTTANGVFLQHGFNALVNFVSMLRDDFRANVATVDFGSMEGVKSVNGWVAKETDGKIGQILNVPDNSTIMALINAIYMKAKWDEAFYESRTSKGDFTVSEAKKVKADLMHQIQQFRYIRESNFSMAFFPYLVTCWEMGILLPDSGSVTLDFVEHLKYESLKKLRDNAIKSWLDVKFPKFRVEASVDLIPMLKRMDVKKAFSNNAELSKISDVAALKVSQVLQKCFVDVDEEGTEAAAITVVKCVPYCASFYEDEPIKFHITSPFLFFIRHVDTGIVLFSGYVKDPSA